MLHLFTSQNNSVAAPQIREICVNYCTEGNCTSECSANNPFRINNITTGAIYNVSVSLRNDFGESGQTTALYGEEHYWVHGVYMNCSILQCYGINLNCFCSVDCMLIFIHIVDSVSGVLLAIVSFLFRKTTCAFQSGGLIVLCKWNLHMLEVGGWGFGNNQVQSHVSMLCMHDDILCMHAWLGTFIHTQPLNTHCLPYTVCLVSIIQF